MIRRITNARYIDDLARLHMRRVLQRCEEVVEAGMRARGRKREPWHAGVPRTVQVDVPPVENDLDRPPSHGAAAQPHERAQAPRQLSYVEQFPWGERVEVTGQQVDAVLMLRNAL